MENIDYVRGKLAAAKDELGRIAQISRATRIDRRTLLSIADSKRRPHAATVDKLAKHFQKVTKEQEARQ